MIEKDAEEKMTELTDRIHSLFRGYANSSYAHKESHLKCLEKLDLALEVIKDYHEALIEMVYQHVNHEKGVNDEKLPYDERFFHGFIGANENAIDVLMENKDKLKQLGVE